VGVYELLRVVVEVHEAASLSEHSPTGLVMGPLSRRMNRVESHGWVSDVVACTDAVVSTSGPVHFGYHLYHPIRHLRLVQTSVDFNQGSVNLPVGH